VTQDDGKTWTNVTPARAERVEQSVMLEASHFDATKRTPPSIGIASKTTSRTSTRTKDGGSRGRRSRRAAAGVYMQTIKEDPSVAAS